MRGDLHTLAGRVRLELENYEIPEAHPKQMGEPLPPEWFEKGLSEMRAALVMPHWLKMHHFDEALGQLVERDVVAVADDGQGSLLVFDPGPEGDFALVVRNEGRIVDINVRGDAVGCFLSR